MNLTKKQLIEKKQYEKSVIKLKKNSASAHLDDTYFLLAQMYSQETTLFLYNLEYKKQKLLDFCF